MNNRVCGNCQFFKSTEHACYVDLVHPAIGRDKYDVACRFFKWKEVPKDASCETCRWWGPAQACLAHLIENSGGGVMDNPATHRLAWCQEYAPNDAKESENE